MVRASTTSPTNPIARWSCDWCLIQNSTRGLSANRRTATAEQTWRTLDHHGLTRPGNTTFMGGFEMLHGHGDCPPAGTLCSIAALQDGMLIIAEIGATGRVFWPYRDILALEVGGQGIIRKDAGLGPRGYRDYAPSLHMTAIAAVINRATRTTTNDAYLRISSHAGEMILSHWKYPPQAIRAGLGRAFVGHMAATRHTNTPSPPPAAPTPAAAVPTAIDELERLTKLHAAGTLTDTEFQMARDRQVQRLHHGS